jgi:hypothetical protein
MFGIWFLGFVGVIVYQAFNAGMNSKSLFYKTLERYGQKPTTVFDFDYVLVYMGFSLVGALFWPISGIVMLGKKFRKEA